MAADAPEWLWLLDLTIGGHVYRYSTEAVTVTDAASLDRQYRDGLVEPDVSYAVSVGLADASVPIVIESEEDWAEIVGDGHALDRCPAVLRRWKVGTALERARVVLRGLTDAPVWGAPHEGLQLSILRSMRDQAQTLIPPQAVVDNTTGTLTSYWPSWGSAYPLVIGAPGHQTVATPYPCVPVPVRAITVAGPSVDAQIAWLGPSDATTVRTSAVFSADDVIDADEAVVETTDALSQSISTATITFTSTADAVGQANYYLGFRDDTAYGGGIKNHRGILVRGGGDVLEWVLRTRYSGAVDWPRVQAVRTRLNAYKVDTYVNDETTNAWDWATTELLPLLPVQMREGPDGVYPALIRYDLTAADAVIALYADEDGGNVWRDSTMQLATEEIANEITVEFQPSNSGAWLERRIVSGQPLFVGLEYGAKLADVRVMGSAICGASQRRYGVRPLRVQAAAIWDPATALLVASDLAQRLAWPRRTVRYVGGARLEVVEIGQAVTITDAELHLSAAVAVVVDVAPRGDEVALDLLLLDLP